MARPVNSSITAIGALTMSGMTRRSGSREYAWWTPCDRYARATPVRVRGTKWNA
jgi:hypothetical protein